VVALLLVGIALPALSARAQAATPHLELRAGTDSVTAEKYKKDPIYLDLGAFVAAIGGPFEVWLTRPDYAQPINVAQRVPEPNGKSVFNPLPLDSIDEWNGFADFFRLDVSKDGELVKSKTFTFCPNSYDRQRVSDSGPVLSTYPDGCYGNAFAKGLVWGIDEEWAVNATSGSDARMRLPKGTYDVHMSVEPRYVEMFGFPEGARTADVELEVTSYGDDCPKCPGTGPRPRDRADYKTLGGVPTVDNPDPATLPDLVALPAWGITANNGKKREQLSFSATVWAGGAQSMVVEGFRHESQELMDAYQYFYKNGKPVGRARVGEMEYDTRDGHNHWHFLQFARYSLLDSTKTEVVRSKKEAFCLAPTDAIDLTLPGVVWTQDVGGLSTACGSRGALWVREVLPLGFGDTYGQFLPGQAFNITDLPNGTYYIEVSANPLGSLFEQSSTNNVELREIKIRGKHGERYVEVPPWNGIDTESGNGQGKGGFPD
jgi:hypothetical protein